MPFSARFSINLNRTETKVEEEEGFLFVEEVDLLRESPKPLLLCSKAFSGAIIAQK